MGRRPARRELLTAAALAAVAALELWATDLAWDASGVAVALVSLIATAAVAWRIQLPTLSALTCSVATAVLMVLDASDHVWLYVLLVLCPFSAARHATPRRAVVVLVVWLTVDLLAGVHESWDGVLNFLANYTFVAALVTIIPWWAGFSLASRQRQSARGGEAAVEEERLRIAREIHDVVGHALGVIAIQAGAERLTLPTGAPDTTTQTLAAIARTAREALTEMRRMLSLLRMDSASSDRLLPQPGLDDVTVLVEGMSSAGMRPELVVEGNPVPLAPGIELSAYRIVQEALTNALKHGARGQVTVTLRYLSGSLEIEVVDPGAVASSRSSSGFGLAGMIERVA